MSRRSNRSSTYHKKIMRLFRSRMKRARGWHDRWMYEARASVINKDFRAFLDEVFDQKEE